MRGQVKNLQRYRTIKAIEHETLNRILPGKISISDVDHEVERKGHFLKVETKPGRVVETGQRILFEQYLNKLPSKMTVWIINRGNVPLDIERIDDSYFQELQIWRFVAGNGIVRTGWIPIASLAVFEWWCEHWVRMAHETPNSFMTRFLVEAGINPPTQHWSKTSD